MHNIATFKMAAALPTRAKRTNKGRFCRAKAFNRNNDVADRLTASWFAIENKKMKEMCVIPKSAVLFTSRLSSCGIKMSWLRLWIMGAVKPLGQLYGSPTALKSQYLA